MSLHHFFLDDQVLSAEEGPAIALRLSPEDLKHALVMRLEPGEHVSIIDASKDYFECRIEEISRDGVSVSICRKVDDHSTDEPMIVLLQGMAKGDKMDDIIRHATEVGVSAFVPVMCERSVVKLDAKKAAVRTQRWRSIAKSAAMQSGRLSVPEVSEPMTVADAAAAVSGAHLVLVFWEESPATRLSDVIADGLARAFVGPKDARIAVVVGPEGGLTQGEVDMLSSGKGGRVVSLGSSILRTETAGIVAPALVAYELGGLGNSITADID